MSHEDVSLVPRVIMLRAVRFGLRSCVLNSLEMHRFHHLSQPCGIRDAMIVYAVERWGRKSLLVPWTKRQRLVYLINAVMCWIRDPKGPIHVIGESLLMAIAKMVAYAAWSLVHIMEAVSRN